MEKDKIAIVMRNHNALPLTENCINSLKKTSYDNKVIYVVDDGSKDGSGKVLEKKFSDISVIFSENYIEYCKGLNLGARIALNEGADYIFFVNNDTCDFSLDIFQQMLSTFEDKKIGLVGPVVYDYDGTCLSSGEDLIRLGLKVNTPTEGYMISKSTFQKVGFLDEKLVRYFEDFDYFIRLRKAGLETKTNNSVSFKHLKGGTSSKQFFVPNFYRVRNLLWFLKHYCKDKSFIWKVQNFKGYMKKHYLVAKEKLMKLQLFFLAGILFSVFLGFMVGLFTKWQKN